MNQSKARSDIVTTSTAAGEPGPMTEPEPLASTRTFQTAVEILRTTGIPFWLDQGTLLGCVRDRRLIPWDQDIDFGVWKDEVDRESLITAFLSTGFEQQVLPQEMDCVHLLSGSGTTVDITFYRKEGPTAVTTWLAPRKGVFRQLIKKLLICLEGSSINKSLYQDQRLKSMLLAIMTGTVRILPQRLKKCLLKQVRPLSLKYPNMEIIRYVIPIELFRNLKDITFLGVQVKIPVDSEKYLALVYGSGWMIPKKDFVWWQECGALEST